MILYEAAVGAINNAVDGSAFGCGTRSAGGRYPDYATGLENKFSAEVTKSSIGIKRSEANEIVKKLIAQYEDKLSDPELGKSFSECFDAKTLKPSEEWLNKYNKVWKEITDLGIERRT
jgi:methylamine--corrinoid protein Co-methyltransferase